MELFQQLAGRERPPGTQALEKGVERPARVAGLRDAVRVQQELVAGQEVVDIDLVRVLDEHAEVQRRCRPPAVQFAYLVPADEDGRRVAAVDDADDPAVRGDLGEDGGHEPFAQLASAQLCRPAVHARLHPARQGGKIGLVVRGLAERAEQGGGGLDRDQTLAADIADEQPDPVRRGDGLVEVAADACLRVGGEVEALQEEVADPVRYRSEQDALRDLRNEAHIGERALPAGPMGGQDRAEGTHQGGADVRGHVMAVPQIADGPARTARGARQYPLEQDREHRRTGDHEGPVGECGHQRHDDQREAHRPVRRRQGLDHQKGHDVQNLSLIHRPADTPGVPVPHPPLLRADTAGAARTTRTARRTGGRHA